MDKRKNFNIIVSVIFIVLIVIIFALFIGVLVLFIASNNHELKPLHSVNSSLIPTFIKTPINHILTPEKNDEEINFKSNNFENNMFKKL